MDDEQENVETLKEFEKELGRLEARRSQIIAEYIQFLEKKRLETVIKKLEKD